MLLIPNNGPQQRQLCSAQQKGCILANAYRHHCLPFHLGPVALHRIRPLDGSYLPSGTVQLQWHLSSQEPVYGFRLCLDGTCTREQNPRVLTTITPGQSRSWTVSACLDRDCRYTQSADTGQPWVFHGYDPLASIYGILSASPPTQTRYNTTVTLSLWLTNTLSTTLRAGVFYLEPRLDEQLPRSLVAHFQRFTLRVFTKRWQVYHLYTVGTFTASHKYCWLSPARETLVRSL